MKVALPIEGDQINQHFGRSQQFIIAEIEGGQIGSLEAVSYTHLDVYKRQALT